MPKEGTLKDCIEDPPQWAMTWRAYRRKLKQKHDGKR